MAAIGYPIGRFGPNLYAELAPADDERDPEPARPNRSSLGALPDHTTDHPRVRTPNPADPAAVPDDPSARPRQT